MENDNTDVITSIGIQVAYEEGYEAGKQAALDRIIEMITAKQAININGVAHYVMTDQQLEVSKNIILEKE